MNLFDTPAQVLLNKAMDTSSLRQKVIANNIANVSTPGFKRSEVIFEDELQKALHQETDSPLQLKTTDQRHFQIEGSHNDGADVTPKIVQLDDLNYRNDENNVDIDVEMAKSTKNNINYDMLSQCMNNELKLIKMAVKGGI